MTGGIFSFHSGVAREVEGGLQGAAAELLAALDRNKALLARVSANWEAEESDAYRAAQQQVNDAYDQLRQFLVDLTGGLGGVTTSVDETRGKVMQVVAS